MAWIVINNKNVYFSMQIDTNVSTLATNFLFTDRKKRKGKELDSLNGQKNDVLLLVL